MKLQDLFENQPIPDAELKKIIKGITTRTADARRNSSGTVIAFGKHRIVNGMVEHLGKELWIDNKLMDENGELIIPFRSCNAIQCRAMKLSSFKNFPLEITGRLHSAFSTSEMYDNPEQKVHSLEGFPSRIAYGIINLSNNKFSELNYSKVNRIIKYAESEIQIHRDYVGPILSFLMIERLRQVYKVEPISIIKTPCKIVTKYLQGDKDDILECQEELVQAGFKEFAKL